MYISGHTSFVGKKKNDLCMELHSWKMYPVLLEAIICCLKSWHKDNVSPSFPFRIDITDAITAKQWIGWSNFLGDFWSFKWAEVLPTDWTSKHREKVGYSNKVKPTSILWDIWDHCNWVLHSPSNPHLAKALCMLDNAILKVKINLMNLCGTIFHWTQPNY